MAVNLGKWILRYLFAKLVDEELERDAIFRKELMSNASKIGSLRRQNAPPSIQLPTRALRDPQNLINDDDAMITPKAVNGTGRPALTPGLSIGVATPSINGTGHAAPVQNYLPTTLEEGSSLEKQTSLQSQPRSSTDKTGDYFSSSPRPRNSADGQAKGSTTPGGGLLDAATQSPVDADRDEKSKEGSSLFGKKFRMNFPKKLGRPSTDTKPAIVDEKSEESEKSEDKEDKMVQDSFLGTIQKIRYEYEDFLQNEPSQQPPMGLTPSLLSETPALRHPPYTTVIIQEERPDSGGVADLYRGTVSSVGRDADLIENVAPMWLAELLLRVAIPVFFIHAGSMLTLIESNVFQRSPQSFLRLVTLSGSVTQYCKRGRVKSCPRRTQ